MFGWCAVFSAEDSIAKLEGLRKQQLDDLTHAIEALHQAAITEASLRPLVSECERCLGDIALYDAIVRHVDVVNEGAERIDRQVSHSSAVLWAKACAHVHDRVSAAVKDLETAKATPMTDVAQRSVVDVAKRMQAYVNATDFMAKYAKTLEGSTRAVQR
jgi:hypothetical protein